MPRTDAAPTPPSFRLWIRRQSAADGPYSLRFTVEDGKGILRVSRPGVLIDPPARATWEEERLTSAQLRSSRFLLVWDGGRARQAYLLTRLGEAQLQRLPEGRWLELEVHSEAGFRHLIAPADIGEAEGDGDGEPLPTASPAFPFSAASLNQAATRSAFMVSSAAMAMFEPEDTEEERRVAAVPPRRLALPDPEDELFAADMDEVTEEEHPRHKSLMPHDDDTGFSIDDDAFFSVDTPSNRMETMHVMRGSVEAVTFLPTGPAPMVDPVDEMLAVSDEDELLAAGEAEDDLIAAGEAEDELLAAHEADDELLAAHEADDELLAAGEADEEALSAMAPSEDEPAPTPVEPAMEATPALEPAEPLGAPLEALEEPPPTAEAPAPSRRRKKKADVQVVGVEMLGEDAVHPVVEPDLSGASEDLLVVPPELGELGASEVAAALDALDNNESSLGRPAPLIRHLRRQIADAQVRMQLMEARIAELEAALALSRASAGS